MGAAHQCDAAVVTVQMLTTALVLTFVLAMPACGSDENVSSSVITETVADSTITSASIQPTTSAEDTTTGCTPGEEPDSTTSTSVPATTSSAAAPSTTESPSSAPSTTEDVDRELAQHQGRLADLGYWLGPIDGRWGSLTAHATTAFQKAEGLSRTGRLDAPTVDRLAIASSPTARSTAGTVLEIDLTRQILLVVNDGVVGRVYDIATGAPGTPTPTGQFAVYREIDGYRHAPLGTLYRPKYFNGGIALHGYTSVPPEPASHGCVRLIYGAMDDLWAGGAASIGTAVWVY